VRRGNGGVTLLALFILLTHAPAVYRGEVPGWKVDWIPQLGLSFSFFVDGLGFFFAALILGIGFLIIVYARFYLTRTDPMGRFYSYLLMFQGSMVGIVLSDNILLLLVFWELTSLTSFLLIGYWSHLPESRQGARMALIVTGGGGLALIAGMLLLGQAAGSYELSEILQRGDEIRASPLYLPTLLLVLVGAFTKSAQFPFHFWLPHAMAAPTPVSAYLHSATMVKAGVFLMARLWPVLAGTDEWFLIVSLTGLVTMVIAAWIAIFKDDLKQLLAFSTVSHLGFMTMLLGMGTRTAAIAAVFHILNHATFKAPLFMAAGIVDHEAHTRDIKRLGGLLILMPITGTLAIIASLSMAGVPLLNGFLSKELMLEEAAGTVYAGNPWLFPVMATVGALLSAAYSARLIFHAFLGKERNDYPHHPHDPPFGMWLPVAVLVALVVVIGILPNLFAQAIVVRTASAVVGSELTGVYFSLWHGFTPALAMSMLAIMGGLAMLAAYQPINRWRLTLLRPEAKRIFEAAIDLCVLACAARARSHPYAIAAALCGRHHAGGDCAGRARLFYRHARRGRARGHPGVCCGTGRLGRADCRMRYGYRAAGRPAADAHSHQRCRTGGRARLSPVLRTGSCAHANFGRGRDHDPAAARAQSTAQENAARRHGAAALCAAWFCGCGGYCGRGPRLCRDDPKLRVDLKLSPGAFEAGRGRHECRQCHSRRLPRLRYLRRDHRSGHRRPCNLALLDSALRGAAARTLDAMRPGISSKDVHPMMLSVVTRVLLPLVVTAGVYIMLRGHNLPGGGFIAGLVVAIAFIMQYMASGYAWAHARAQIDAQVMIGGGLALAGMTGVASWVFARPFLTSTFGYVHLPVVGEFELASAMVFDIGVFFTVVGTVLISLATISRVEARAERAPGHPERQDPRLPSAVARAQRKERGK
jgi:monovalent cation:proton antiporter